jgi:hypothetical protein
MHENTIFFVQKFAEMNTCICGGSPPSSDRFPPRRFAIYCPSNTYLTKSDRHRSSGTDGEFPTPESTKQADKMPNTIRSLIETMSTSGDRVALKSESNQTSSFQSVKRKGRLTENRETRDKEEWSLSLATKSTSKPEVDRQ